MKAVFFLLFLLVVAGGAWFVAPTLDLKNVTKESVRDFALDQAEEIINWFIVRFPETVLEKRAGDWLGYCQVMAPPPDSSKNPLADLKPAKGVRFPFARDVDITRIDLLCAFPGHGKSIFIVPNHDTTVRMKRRPDKPAVLTLLSGGITLFSDQLDFEVNVGGMVLSLRSDKPTKVWLSYQGTHYDLIVRKGTVDVAYTLQPDAQPKPIQVQVQVEDSGVLTHEGKPVQPQPGLVLLPSGFQANLATPALPPGMGVAPDEKAIPPGTVTPAPPPAAAPVTGTAPGAVPAPAGVAPAPAGVAPAPAPAPAPKR